jgi:hypothetical protein
MLPLFFIFIAHHDTKEEKERNRFSFSFVMVMGDSKNNFKTNGYPNQQVQSAIPITTATAIRNRNVGRGNPGITVDHRTTRLLRRLQ